jgi:hypothetical protein
LEATSSLQLSLVFLAGVALDGDSGLSAWKDTGQLLPRLRKWGLALGETADLEPLAAGTPWKLEALCLVSRNDPKWQSGKRILRAPAAAVRYWIPCRALKKVNTACLSKSRSITHIDDYDAPLLSLAFLLWQLFLARFTLTLFTLICIPFTLFALNALIHLHFIPW